MPGDVCFSALLVFHQAPAWFFDPYTQEITQKFCLWPELGRVAVKYPELAGERYIALSETVANIQAWRQIIHNDLASPISVFSAPGWGKNSISRKTFNSLLLKIWVLDLPDHKFTDDTDKSFALALTALSKAWDIFQLTDPAAIHEALPLVRCTLSASLRVEYFHPYSSVNRHVKRSITPSFRTLFSCRLGQSLIKAAETARKAIHIPDHGFSVACSQSPIPKELYLPKLADIMETLGQEVGNKFEPGSGTLELGGSVKEYNNWSALGSCFREEIDALEAIH
jgi:hypothetical protein